MLLSGATWGQTKGVGEGARLVAARDHMGKERLQNFVSRLSTLAALNFPSSPLAFPSSHSAPFSVLAPPTLLPPHSSPCPPLPLIFPLFPSFLLLLP